MSGLKIESTSDSSFWYFKHGKLPMHTHNPADYAALKHKFIAALHNPEAIKDSAVREVFKSGYADFFTGMANRNGASYSAKDATSAASVQPVTLLQDFSVKYANPGLMSLALMPIRPTPTEAGQYLEYLRGAEFQPQRQRGGGGTRTIATQVPGYRPVKQPYQCEPYTSQGNVGKDLVLSKDVSPIDPMFNLRESVDRALAMQREDKVIQIVTDLNSYSTSNRRTLTAGYHWDEPEADIQDQLLRAKTALWSGSGTTMTVAWCSSPVWNSLRKSRSFQRILSASHQGFMTPEEFCDIMQIDALLVSELRFDDANIAEDADYTRAWGNNFGLMRVSMYSQRDDASFGATYRWMPSGLPEGMETNLWFDPNSSAFGDFHYKTSLKETHVVVAKDTGYLFKNVLSPATPLY